MRSPKRRKKDPTLAAGLRAEKTIINSLVVRDDMGPERYDYETDLANRIHDWLARGADQEALDWLRAEKQRLLSEVALGRSIAYAAGNNLDAIADGFLETQARRARLRVRESEAKRAKRIDALFAKRFDRV